MAPRAAGGAYATVLLAVWLLTVSSGFAAAWVQLDSRNSGALPAAVVLPSVAVYPTIGRLLEGDEATSLSASTSPWTDSSELPDAVRTSATGPTSAASVQPGTVVTGFEGLHYGSNSGFNTNVAPPDVPLAAGPSHVMQLVNGLGAIYWKNGTQAKIFRIQTLFKVPTSDGVGDPRVLYDALSGRWFASAADFTTGSVVFAVSTSDDPTSTWNAYNFTAAGSCPDQPLLGLSDDKIVLFANVFSGCSGSFLGGEFWVVNKTDLVSGTSPRSTHFGPSTSFLSMFPVHSLSTTTTQYMVRAIPTNTIRLYTVTGTPPGTVSVTTKDLAVSTISTGINAVQPGTSYVLDTGDYRVRDAMWNQGRLWLGLDDGCRSSGDTADRACFRLAQIDTTNKTVLQDFDVGASGTYYFFPAMRTDVFGNLVVVFGYSSSAVYPSVAIAYRSPSDPINTLQPPTTVRTGTGAESPPSGYCLSTVCRYGDYSGAGIDPATPSVVWTASEYGTSSGWATYISAFRASTPAQVTLTFSYSLQGGGSGYQAPTLTYTSDGTTKTTTLTGTPNAYSADAGSFWSVTNPLSGSSSSERWQTNQATSGTATSSIAVQFDDYHQYRVSFAVQVVGGGVPGAMPRVNCTQFGATVGIPAGGSDWADAGGSYAFPATFAGSDSGERWQSAAPPSGTVPGPTNVTATYYHEYNVVLGFQVLGGGTGSSGPSVDYIQMGQPRTTAAGASVWADAGSLYLYSDALPGATSTERWPAPAPGGVITGAGSLNVAYIHQYLVSFKYTVLGGGSGYSAPNVTYVNLSRPMTTTVDVPVWADAGTTYQYESPLPGSKSNESWRTRDGTGTITHAGTYTATYRHQFRMRMKATSTSGSPTPEAPLVNVTQFGTTVSIPAGDVDWVDAGGTYSFPAVFYGPLAGERWVSDTPPSGTVTGPVDITATYFHQFYLTIQVNAANGGVVSGSAGWYNETAMVTLQASGATGWRFEGWIGSGTGSYSGPTESISIAMDSPITETAVFYAGLTLSAGAGGSLYYSYGGTTGWIPAETSTTMYVAPGTPVTIAANPSLFHDFQGWRGGASGAEATVTVPLDSPTSVSAAFEISLYSKADSVLGVSLALAAALGLVAVVSRRRRRQKRIAALRAARMRVVRP